MSKSEGKGTRAAGRSRFHATRLSCSCKLRLLLILLLVLLFFAGCRQDMQDQPKMKPFRGTTFYADGLSARQPIQGTVARGFLREDTEFFTGKRSRTTAGQGGQAIAGQQTQGQAQQQGQAQTQQQGQQQQSPVPGEQNSFPDDIDYFPIPVTEDVVRRGRDRYDIFCSACHGLTGNGDGMIVRRGFRRAASFNDDRLRQAPVGHFFDAITNGWGAMPAYASQVAVQDRWAIVAYIRALQESQRNLTTPAASPSPSPATGGRQ